MKRTQETVQIATEMETHEVFCQNKRNKFLNCLKSHFHLIKLFAGEHKKLLDRMFILSTKLSVLERDDRPKCLPYSKELLWKVRGEILAAINSIVSMINQNLQQQSNSYISLRQSHEQFIISSEAIDWNTNSRLINGSATEKSLCYYVDHSFDIMYCLNIYEKSVQFNKIHLNVRDTSLITRFLNAVTIPQNFRDLVTAVLLNSYFVDKTEKYMWDYQYEPTHFPFYSSFGCSCVCLNGHRRLPMMVIYNWFAVVISYAKLPSIWPSPVPYQVPFKGHSIGFTSFL